jgi:hypothetical protein
LIDQHADHYHFDTGKGWQSSRDAAGGSDPLGGGHAHCGAMIYLGDNWPDEYRGKLMTLNYHGRRINVDRLDRQGSGYVGRHEPDICFSADPFFRGIDLTYGPDGGVFILDWSDTGECHESTGVHRSSGRIYKITYQGAAKRNAPQGAEKGVDLTKLSYDELAKLHEHRNEWFVRMARREILERSFLGVLDSGSGIGYFAGMAKDEIVQLRARYTEYALAGFDERFFAWALHESDSEFVRALAIRTFFDRFALDTVEGQSRARLGKADYSWDFWEPWIVKEKSPFVRLVWVSSMMRMPSGHNRGMLLKELAQLENMQDDHNYSDLLWYALSVRGLSSGYYAQTFDVTNSSHLRRNTARYLASKMNTEVSALDDIIYRAGVRSPAAQGDILTGMIEGFTGWRKAPKPDAWDEFAARVNASGDASLIAKVRDLNVLFGDGRALDEVRKVALDDNSDLGARKSALQTLIDTKPEDLRNTCEKLLAVRFLNTVAAKGLVQFDDPAIGLKLAQSYRSFHPSERAAVIEALLTRPTFAKALLDEIATGKIEKTDLGAYHARQIHSLNDPELTKRLAEVWGNIRESAEDKRALMAKLKAQLTPAVLGAADKGSGRVDFESICATCHTLYGQGGPDRTRPDRGRPGKHRLSPGEYRRPRRRGQRRLQA